MNDSVFHLKKKKKEKKSESDFLLYKRQRNFGSSLYMNVPYISQVKQTI